MMLSTRPTGTTLKFYESKAKIQPWRWRLKHANGKIVAASSEGFATKASAKRNAQSTRDGLVKAL